MLRQVLERGLRGAEVVGFQRRADLLEKAVDRRCVLRLTAVAGFQQRRIGILRAVEVVRLQRLDQGAERAALRFGRTAGTRPVTRRRAGGTVGLEGLQRFLGGVDVIGLQRRADLRDELREG